MSKKDSNNFHPLSSTNTDVASNFYADIKWDDGFEQWDLVRFATPGDGNCLFHALANSFYQPYRTETIRGKHVPRNKIISLFRKELSEKLSKPISSDTNAPTFYETLNNKNTLVFSKDVPEFTLDYMKNQLNSTNSIGYGYIEYIGNVLNKDIYILEASRKNIYKTDEPKLSIKGNRPSVILYYINDNHYELLGIKNDDGTFSTHFSPEHKFVRFLYNKL